MEAGSMFSTMYMYAWDLSDEGLDEVLGRIGDWGVDAIAMASSYHTGYFIHSHNPNHKMYFAEDGVVYFQPDERYFESTDLKPKVAAVSRTTDWFEAAGERLDRYGLRMMAWTVCTHNSRLGAAHPGHVVRNVYGDAYTHALCPSSSHVRRYVLGLCQNLAAEYPLHAVQLEAPGFRGMEHGHHHERYGTPLRPLETWLMSLCFCESCQDRASALDLDLSPIAQGVEAHMNRYFETAPLAPPGSPATRNEMLEYLPRLAEMESFRAEVESSLVQEIAESLHTLGDTRLFALEGHRPDYMPHVDGFTANCYGRRPNETGQVVRTQRRLVGNERELAAGFGVGFNAVLSPGEMSDVVAAAASAGASGVSFYNYSEAPMRALERIKPALEMANSTK
jgi:hypothetical protein